MFHTRGLSPVLDAHLRGPHGHGTKPMGFWLIKLLWEWVKHYNILLWCWYCGETSKKWSNGECSYCQYPHPQRWLGMWLQHSILRSHVIHHTDIRQFAMGMQVYMHNTRETQEKNFAKNIEKKYLNHWIIQLYCKFSLLTSWSKSEVNREELVSPCAVPLFTIVTCSFLQAWGQPLQSLMIAMVQTHFHFLS